MHVRDTSHRELGRTDGSTGRRGPIVFCNSDRRGPGRHDLPTSMSHQACARASSCLGYAPSMPRWPRGIQRCRLTDTAEGLRLSERVGSDFDLSGLRTAIGLWPPKHVGERFHLCGGDERSHGLELAKVFRRRRLIVSSAVRAD